MILVLDLYLTIGECPFPIRAPGVPQRERRINLSIVDHRGINRAIHNLSATYPAEF